MGIVDDLAVLAETDIKHKDKIAQRKSVYSQLSSQIEQMEKQMQDKEGTIETLERQLVQAGIKSKVMQGEMEVNRKVAERKASVENEYNQTKTLQQQLREDGRKAADAEKQRLQDLLNNLPIKKD